MTRLARLTERVDRRAAVAGLVAVVVLLGLLLPWLRADPPHGLTWSNAPYTDEGLYNDPGRNFALFGVFGHLGLYREVTNTSFAGVGAVLFSLVGPSIAAARVLSVLSVCVTVVAVMWGLARSIGFGGVLLAGAGIGGSQLVLLYGRIGIVEPFETMLLVTAFVAMARGFLGGRWGWGVASGLALALAASAKASAFLAFPAVLALPIVIAVATRAWSRLLAPAAATGALGVASGLWYLFVERPHRAEFRAGSRTLVDLGTYPRSIGGVINRLWHWLSHPATTDHVLGWSLPLLVAAAVGVAACVLLGRGRPEHLYVTAAGLVWALPAWALPVLNGYSPNRYFVVAVPGLALAAGPGCGLLLERSAAVLGAARWAGLAGAAGALALATPGVVSYLGMETPVYGTHQLGRDQLAVESVLPRGAVVYGFYAPEMAFSAPVHTVLPWPASGLHMRDPVARYRVGYFIADVSPTASANDRALMRAVLAPGVTLGQPLVEVPWGPHMIAVLPVRAA